MTLTLILILFVCNAVSAANNSNNTTQSNNCSTQLSTNPTAATMNSAPSKVVISGKVLKCSDGTPFSGVTVTASKGGTKLASTTTSDDGTYTLSFLSSDTVFNVTASYPGHISSSKNVAVASGAADTSYGAANFKMGLAYVYVSPSGNDGHSGDSSHPVQTIEKALSLVNNGGTIYLASGTYSGNGNTGLTIEKNVTIIGQGQTNTIIDGLTYNPMWTIRSGVTVTIKGLTFANGKAGYGGGALYNAGCTCTVNDCTFTNNKATNGGAIYNTGTVSGYGILTVRGCTFTGNNANGGGAIYNYGWSTDSMCTIIDSTFTGNNATKGGAIYNQEGLGAWSTCNVTTCTFTNNNASTTITEGNGGAIYNGQNLYVSFSDFEKNNAESGTIWTDIRGNSNIFGCTFTNNHATNIGGVIENYGTTTINLSTFTGNTANFAGVISNYGSLTIGNSTFTGNTAANDGGVISNDYDGNYGSNSPMNITGNVFKGNSATKQGSVIYCGDKSGNCEIHFNSIYGNTGTYDIYSVSKTINAINNWWGTNFSGTDPETAGRVNSNVDADPWIMLTLTSSDNLVDLGGITTVKANLKYNSAGTDVSSSGTVPDEDIVFAVDSLGSISPTSGTISKNLNATTTFTAGSKAGNSVVSVAVNGHTVTTTIKIRDLSNVYVNPNTGNDSTGDGSSTAPLQSLAKAISEVRAGGTVHVAKGTYSGANNRGIRIDKDVTIIGESQNNTIIDAQGQNSTFFVGNDFTVTIKNLMFSNGNATSSGSGGAIVSSGTLNLSNCTFINNTAEIHGGAIYTNHPLNISGCTFTGNTAKYGGAIRGISYDPYTFTVHFSSFVNNTATTGNAIYCDNHGSINAENNWWGSNNPAFSSLVSENVDCSPWMVLNITSNTATVKKGGSAAITVNMLYDSDGNYHNPASGHVPDSTGVKLTGTLGSLNPTGSTLIDGQTTSIFTANAAGTAVVKATVDDETVQTSITIAKANTNLVAGNAAGVNGKTVNLTATLTDENGNPVDGEIVNFNVNGN
ncbi:MAG: carboxypeptidase regulatory-like domain-containing protein, partial [Methanobacterium sp.]